MIDEKDEIIESLQAQNDYWAHQSEELLSENVTLYIFLIATTLMSVFGLSWVVSDLIGILWK